MWSREPSTVRSVRQGIVKIIDNSRKLGISPNLPPLGPWPLQDTVAFTIVLAQLRYAQNQGNNQTTHFTV